MAEEIPTVLRWSYRVGVDPAAGLFISSISGILDQWRWWPLKIYHDIGMPPGAGLFATARGGSAVSLTP